MAQLKKADILNCNDRKTITLDVPEWGGELTLRVMSGIDREAWENQSVNLADNTPKLGDIRCKMLACCIVDVDTGKLMFEAKDIKALGEKSSIPLARLHMECLKLNKLRREEVEEMAGK